jgi:2'-5' RNA ligase
MSRGEAVLRLFVSIPVPGAMADALLRETARVELPAGVRFRDTPAGQVHMTVQFIGDTPARSLEDVVESVRRSASGLGAFRLTPARLITLPERGWPRLIAAETDAPPAILELHRRLATRLARSGDRRNDRFRPHITLRRFTGGARAPEVARPLEAGAFGVPMVLLMKSALRPHGAEHTEIARALLE